MKLDDFDHLCVEQLAPAAQPQNIKSLLLSWSEKWETKLLNKELEVLLRPLYNLAFLEIRDWPSDVGTVLDQMAPCETLTLSLLRCQNVRGVFGRPEIRRIIVERDEINDTEVNLISSLPNLKSIELTATRVVAAGTPRFGSEIESLKLKFRQYDQQKLAWAWADAADLVESIEVQGHLGTFPNSGFDTSSGFCGFSAPLTEDRFKSCCFKVGDRIRVVRNGRCVVDAEAANSEGYPASVSKEEWLRLCQRREVATITTWVQKRGVKLIDEPGSGLWLRRKNWK